MRNQMFVTFKVDTSSEVTKSGGFRSSIEKFGLKYKLPTYTASPQIVYIFVQKIHRTIRNCTI